MRHIKIILTIFFSFSIYYTYATNDSICGTESLDSATFVNLPWIENNQFLLNLVDSVENSCSNCRTSPNGLSTKKYQVPIKAVVFYNDTYNGITDIQVQQYIKEANRIFDENGVAIQFYLVCEVARYYSINTYIDSESKKDYVLSSFLHPNAITVHFVHSRANGFASGSALLPYKWGDKYSCYIITEGSYYSFYANSLAHELGHTLGLLHTHDKGRYTNKDNAKCNNCNQESVNKNKNQEVYCWFKFSSGKKCDRNGDGLCDTDADPNWSEKGYVESNCSTYFYQGGDSDYEKDNYGDYWGSLGNNNAMRNIMSYSRSSCRTEFTEMQKGVMYHSVLKSGLAGAQSNSSKFHTNSDLDNYEPDNFWFGGNLSAMQTLGNKIDVNSQQYHTFHYSNNSSDNWEACDIDWVYFQNNSGSAKDFIIQTMEVSGKPKPDTKITLYPVNSSGVLGTVITSHDDISTTNLFSKITRNLANGYYAVKIENKVTSTSDSRSKGHYYIRVDECYDKTNVNVTGSNTVCSSPETYSVSNIPTGSTVTWYTIPASQLVFTYSGNSCSVMLNGNATGEINLYAVVTTSTPCVSQETFVKTLRLNKPQYQWYGSTTENIAKANSFDEIEQNLQCYGGVGHDVYWLAPFSNYDNITWTKITSYPTTSSALWSAYSTDKRQIKVLLRSINATLTLKAEATNTCGTETKTFNFATNGVSCALGRGVDSTTMHEVDYYDAYMSNQTLVITYKDKEEENQTELSSIILSDKMGNIILEKTDGSIKENKIEIDLSRYKSDNYFLLLLYKDGNIEPQQIVKF